MNITMISHVMSHDWLVRSCDVTDQSGHMTWDTQSTFYPSPEIKRRTRKYWSQLWAVLFPWVRYNGLRCRVMSLRYTSMQSSFFCTLFPLLLPRVSKALARRAASTPLSLCVEASQRNNWCRAWERVHDRAYNVFVVPSYSLVTYSSLYSEH